MTDPKRLVAASYDQIAEIHAAWAVDVRIAERERYLGLLCDMLPAGAAVLELGCGVGEPVTRRLAERFQVTAVDIAPRQIELARERIPSATFIHADMTALDMPDAVFDAVTGFYSLIHPPREELPALLQSIARWLKPGGLLVATFGAADDPGSIEADWHGAPMYWSTFATAENRRLVEAAGLTILSAAEETADEDGDPVTFLWIVARKPN